MNKKSFLHIINCGNQVRIHGKSWNSFTNKYLLLVCTCTIAVITQLSEDR